MIHQKIKFTDTIHRPCEWVLPGHPDRLCDSMAHKLAITQSFKLPDGHAAIEVAVHRETLYLTGRYCLPNNWYAPDPYCSAKRVWVHAGYRVGGHWGPSPVELKIVDDICYDKLHDGEAESRKYSDDQCIITGYAINIEGTQFMPPEHWFARNLAKSLFNEVETDLELCPDGKVLIELEEFTGLSGQRQFRLSRVSASLLAHPRVGELTLRMTLIKHIKHTVQKGFEAFGLLKQMPNDDQIILNGSGNFHIGGPEGDNGLSGKKLVLDYYGPRVPIGGGAIWGKDFNKPDNAGAYIARNIALEVVQRGLAHEATVTCAIVPGAESLCIRRIQTPEGDLHPDCWPANLNLRIDQFRTSKRRPDSHVNWPVEWGFNYTETTEHIPALGYLQLERGGEHVSWGKGVRDKVIQTVREMAKLPDITFDW